MDSKVFAIFPVLCAHTHLVMLSSRRCLWNRAVFVFFPFTLQLTAGNQSLRVFGPIYFSRDQLSQQHFFLCIARMEAYVAMSTDTHEKVLVAGMVDSESLGLPPHVRFIPLKRDRKDAIRAAIRSDTTTGGRSARMHHDWFVLQLNWKAEDAFKLYDTGSLSLDLWGGGWKLFQSVDLSDISHTWFSHTTPPLADEEWCGAVLCRHRRIERGTCLGCDHEGEVFRGSSEECYCMRCWSEFYAGISLRDDAADSMEED